MPCIPAVIGCALVFRAGGGAGLRGRLADVAGRRGAHGHLSSELLPETLHLQWVRQYPPLKPAFWQPRQERLQFDLGYEPVVLQGRRA